MEHDKNKEQVDHPSHYQGLEVIDAMEIAYGTKAVAFFCVLNRFKYLCRAGKKSEDTKEEDIAKAKWYGDKYQELLCKMRACKDIKGLPVDEIFYLKG